jgi:hypothetical protein
MCQLDWPITPKKKLWRLPKTEGSILKYKVPPLWPSYIGERRTTCAKAYGIKVRCYGEHVGEQIVNLRNILKTCGNPLRLKRNIVGTHWEPRKNEKNPCLPATTPQNLKGKEPRHHECMLGPSHWLHAKKNSNRVCHHYWPQPIPLAKNTLPIHLSY